MISPGQYLQRRRATAGHSLAGLARSLAALSSFGSGRGLEVERGINFHLAAAESDALILPLPQLEVLANYVPIDPHVYRDLVDVAERRTVAFGYRICRNCGATDSTMPRDPFSGLPGAAASWAEPNLCSHCAGSTTPAAAAPVTIVADPNRAIHKIEGGARWRP